MMKKLIYVLTLSFIFCFGWLLIIPNIYEKKIKKAIDEFLQENIQANIEIKNQDITFFKRFPHLTVSLKDISVEKKASIQHTKLIYAKKLDLKINIWKMIWNRDIQLQEIQIHQPQVHLKVDKQGKNNYAFRTTKKHDTKTKFIPKLDNVNKKLTQKPHTVHWKIKDGTFIYEDEQKHCKITLQNIQQQGRGKKIENIFHTKIKTNIASLSGNYKGKKYHINKNIVLDNEIDSNREKNTLQIKNSTLHLEKNYLHLKGYIQKYIHDYNIDIHIQGNSLLENIATSFLPKNKCITNAQGKLFIRGNIQGMYNSKKEIIPTFDIALKIDKAACKYWQTPIQNICCEANIINAKTDWKDAEIKIEKLSANIGKDKKEHLYMRLYVRHPENLCWHAYIKGGIHLEKIFPQHPVQGFLATDITSRGNLKALQNKQYNQLFFKGNMQLKKAHFDLKTWQQKINIEQCNVTLQENNFNIQKCIGKINDIPLNAQGKLIVKDNTLHIFPLTLLLYNGKCNIKGQYTFLPHHPFTLDLKANNLSTEKIFSQHNNIIQKYIPTIKKTSGRLSTKLQLKGHYKANNIDYATLYGTGSIQTKKTKLETEPILQEITSMAQLPPITTIYLDDLQMKYTIKHNKIIFNSFMIKLDKYPTEITGIHDIKGNMHYKLKTKADTGILGKKANNLFSSLGLESFIPSNMIFKFIIKGHYTNPSIIFLGTE